MSVEDIKSRNVAKGLNTDQLSHLDFSVQLGEDQSVEMIEDLLLEDRHSVPISKLSEGIDLEMVQEFIDLRFNTEVTWS